MSLKQLKQSHIEDVMTSQMHFNFPHTIVKGTKELRHVRCE